MENVAQIPAWLGTAVLGAVIAAVGYVAKLILESVGEVRTRVRTRRARLAELLSLLRAGKAAFLVQCENRDRLAELIEQRNPELAKSAIGYEDLFATAYPTMTQRERELHAIIRTITVNALRPLNESALVWLREDTYFKALAWGTRLRARIAEKLAELEAHLLLWHAKYLIWIPEQLEHSLVYLADEQKHGVGFPTNIETDIQDLLKKKWWIGV
jgi:hypothetical protein